MNIQFIDSRQPQPSSSLQLNIAQGRYSFSVSSVRALKLHKNLSSELVIDADTQEWYVCLGQVPGRRAILMRPDGKGAKRDGAQAMTVCNAGQTAHFFSIFDLPAGVKSFSLELAQTPTPHTSLVLHHIRTAALKRRPASEQLPAAAPAPVAPAPTAPDPAAHVEAPQVAAAAEPAVPLEPAPESITIPVEELVEQPEAAQSAEEPAAVAKGSGKSFWSPKDLKQLADEYPTADLDELAARMGRTKKALVLRASIENIHRQVSPKKPKASTTPKEGPPAPAMEVSHTTPSVDNWKPRPTKEQAEKLSNYWKERELSDATDSEVNEVIDVLSRLREQDAGVWERLVLQRAQNEHKRRNLHLKRA